VTGVQTCALPIYWVLKLLKDNFHPGDKLVANSSQSRGDSEVMVQGFITPQGKKVLIVNKTNSDKTVKLSSELQSATSFTIDEATGDDEPRTSKVSGDELKMAPYAVSVLIAQ